MTTHNLKIWPDQFKAVRSGIKPFEWRKNDRGFQLGDILALAEFDPTTGQYSGESINARVTYMLSGPSFGVPDGYVIMGISNLA